ncbi:MAG: hypothetical protein U0996_18455 [Planctomycetaceae bacterium]
MHLWNIRVITGMIVLAFGSDIALAQATGQDGVDDVKGARWDFVVKDGDETIAKGFFRVQDKVIYKGKSKVGRIEAESRTETELIIDDFEKLNGKAKLKKVAEKPPVWEGTLKKDGKRYQMKVTFKDG